MNCICAVEISFRSSFVFAKALHDDELAGCEFAFYLLVDGKKEAVIWYGESNEAKFDLTDVSGMISVKVFCRNQSGGISSKISKIVFFSDRIRVPRKIKLKEWSPNARFHKKPSANYLANTQGLASRNYYFSTDCNGFIVPEISSSEKNGYENWFFFGDSFIESLFVDEGRRFHDVLQDSLDRKNKKVRVYNAGCSGITMLQIFNVILNKVVPLKPKKIIISVPGTDRRCLVDGKGYWRDEARYAPLTPPARAEENLDFNQLEAILNLCKSVCDSVSAELHLCSLCYRTEYENDGFLKKVYPSKDEFERDIVEGKRFNDFLRRWCSNQGVSLIDLPNEFQDYQKFTYDALHLNQYGSSRLAEIFMEKLSFNTS